MCFHCWEALHGTLASFQDVGLGNLEEDDFGRIQLDPIPEGALVGVGNLRDIAGAGTCVVRTACWVVEEPRARIHAAFAHTAGTVRVEDLGRNFHSIAPNQVTLALP